MDLPPPIKNDPPAIVRKADVFTSSQTYTYRGRSFQFTATTPELADEVRRAIRDEVDGTTPKAMPAAPPPVDLNFGWSSQAPAAPAAPACRLVWNGRAWVTQCPNAK